MGNQSFALRGIEIVELERRALAGDEEAAIKLANYYGFFRGDSEQQVHWLRVCAVAESIICQTNLGQLLLILGEPGMADEAIGYLEMAANAGGATAQLYLAESYEDGKGTTVDLAAARKWYERSARQGTYGAMVRSGEFALGGVGGPVDEVLGVTWLLKARKTRRKGSVPYRELSDMIDQARAGILDSQFEEAKRAADR